MFLALFIGLVKANEIEDEITWMDYGTTFTISLFLALCGGLMSGLTIGLMGIDEMNMKLKLESGTPEEQYQARRILPIIRDHHLVLVTLLLCNAIALETLPIVIDKVLGGVLAVLISTLLTVFFAEVIPQSIFIGEYRVPLASFFATFLRILMIFLWPISYPIARLLDKTIGESETKLYKENELKFFFSYFLKPESRVLTPRQVSLIHSGIDMKSCPIETLMIPKSQMFTLDVNQRIDDKILEEISSRGYERIPVLDEGNVKGIVFLRDFLGGYKNVKEMEFKKFLYMNSNMTVHNSLIALSQSGCQLGVICNEKEILGVITLRIISKFLIRKELEVDQSLHIARTEKCDVKKESVFRRIINNMRSKKKKYTGIKEFQLSESVAYDADRKLLDDDEYK